MPSSATIMALMSLRTTFTEMTGVEHPIALAPMDGCSGGALAAAVSNAGGLGLVGGGRASVTWCREQVTLRGGVHSTPVGVGFLARPSASRHWRRSSS